MRLGEVLPGEGGAPQKLQKCASGASKVCRPSCNGSPIELQWSAAAAAMVAAGASMVRRSSCNGRRRSFNGLLLELQWSTARAAMVAAGAAMVAVELQWSATVAANMRHGSCKSAFQCCKPTVESHRGAASSPSRAAAVLQGRRCRRPLRATSLPSSSVVVLQARRLWRRLHVASRSSGHHRRWCRC